MNEIIKKIEDAQLREDAPQFRVGDTVRVHAKIKEGTRERIQIFEGVVIKRVFCDSDTLLLRTDNPLHPSMSIPLAEAGRLIGRVAWVFQAI